MHLPSKRAIVEAMTKTGRAGDLREIILGISRFCVASNRTQNAWSASDERLSRMAELHLEFVADFGTTVQQAVDGKRLRFAYWDDFNAWLDAGAPGVELEELRAHLEENPVNARCKEN